MPDIGVVGKTEVLTSKASGKPYALIHIGGTKYIGFGDTVGHVSRVQTGQTVEYAWKASDKPDGTPLLTYVKASSGSPTTPSGAQASSGAVTPSADDRTRDIHRQVCWKMAVELIAAGRIKTDVTTIPALADTVRTLGDAILDKYEHPYGAAGEPTDPT